MLDVLFIILGADFLYWQLHDFDMCVAKNEEALRIEPHFAECYGNMANAWKVSNRRQFSMTVMELVILFFVCSRRISYIFQNQ